jgi:hypothetical protein
LDGCRGLDGDRAPGGHVARDLFYLGSRIDNVIGRIDNLGARIDTRFDAVNARLDRIEERLSDHIARHTS